MPLFSRSRRRDGADSSVGEFAPSALPDQHHASTQPTPRRQLPDSPPRPKLVFHCQLAHGSPTAVISGFTNVKELYLRIAESHDMTADEILFCTLNTHKIDMSKLLGAQIGLDDFIFAHIKGQTKEVEILKTEEALGLTITDNGAGRCFIKRIKEGSAIAKIGHVQVGDHVERISNVSMVNCRHFEVARVLKNIPVGSLFTLRLVEPMKAGFANIGPRSGGPKSGKTSSYGSGRATLRLRADGSACIQQAPTDTAQVARDKINSLLESFFGINDAELAARIWELSELQINAAGFAEAIDNSDLEAFGFTDEFVFELWGAIRDIKAGRVSK